MTHPYHFVRGLTRHTSTTAPLHRQAVQQQNFMLVIGIEQTGELSYPNVLGHTLIVGILAVKACTQKR